MTTWTWGSIVCIVAGQASYAVWAWRSSAGWRAVFIGAGFAILNAIIFTEHRGG